MWRTSPPRCSRPKRSRCRGSRRPGGPRHRCRPRCAPRRDGGRRAGRGRRRPRPRGGGCDPREGGRSRDPAGLGALDACGPQAHPGARGERHGRDRAHVLHRPEPGDAAALADAQAQVAKLTRSRDGVRAMLSRVLERNKNGELVVGRLIAAAPTDTEEGDVLEEGDTVPAVTDDPRALSFLRSAVASPRPRCRSVVARKCRHLRRRRAPSWRTRSSCGSSARRWTQRSSTPCAPRASSAPMPPTGIRPSPARRAAAPPRGPRPPCAGCSGQELRGAAAGDLQRHRRRLARGLGAPAQASLGVDLPTAEPDLGPVVERFRDENVALIRSWRPTR